MNTFRRPLQITLLVLLTLLVYLNSFKGTWHFDDERAILDNHTIKRLEPISDILRLNRPVLQLTFALNYYLGGLDIWGYHLVNLLLHLGVVLLIYAIGLRLVSAQRALSPSQPSDHTFISLLPFWSALLYAVHPVHTESVTYIVSRSSVLTTFFYMIGFWGFLWATEGWKKEKRLQALLGMILVGAAFLLGLGAKEIIITLPVMALVYLYLFVYGGEHPLPFIKRHKWILIAFGLILITYLLYRHTHGGIAATLAARQKVRSVPTHVLTELTVIALYYLPRLCIPVGLNVDPDVPIMASLLAPKVFLSILILGGLIALAYYSRQRAACLSFGILWFLITLAPTSSIIPLLDVAAEHRLYLPGMGFCLAGACAILWAVTRLPPIPLLQRGIAFGLLSLIALSFSLGTIHRNRVYHSSLALWKNTVAKSPNKWRPRNNLGDAYEKAGKLEEAEREYQFILFHYPHKMRAYYGLGNVYQRQGKIKEAVEAYKKALALDPDFALAYNNLGSALDVLGMAAEAEQAYRIALKLKPGFIKPYNNLAILYAQQGALDRALEMVQKALQKDPNYAIGYNTLGRIYIVQKRYEAAATAFQRSLKIKPDLMESLYALGQVEQSQGNLQKALHWYSRALELNPNSALIHRVLGGLYFKPINDPQRAAYHLSRALQLNPEFPDADNIRSMLAVLQVAGDTVKAEELFPE